MSDTIEMNRGESLRAQVAWTDEGGPIDLAGRTLSIIEANPPSLIAGEVVVTDAAAGLAELRIEGEVAAHLRGGRTNWVRLAMTLDGAVVDTTPPIWISVE